MGVLLVLVVVLPAFGYYKFSQEMKSVATVCPLMIKGGDCECFVDAFAVEYGIVRGVVENMPVVGRVVEKDASRLDTVMAAAARACGAELQEFEGATQ